MGSQGLGLRKIALKSIRANKVALRQVDRTSEAYLGLVDSIKLKGFGGAITAREVTDSVTGDVYYEIIDGLHRYSASKDAGLSEIGVDVQDLDDDQVLEAQITANLHKIETKPADYARQLRRVLGRNNMMTESELASRLGKSPQWIKSMLGLTKISNEKILTLVNSGKIPLMSAYALAKLPESEQASFVDRAMTLPPKEFVPLADDRAKELRDAARKGKKAGEATFEPRSHARKLKDIQAATGDRGFLTSLLKSNKVTDPVDAAVLTLQWCQHLDPASAQAQSQKHEDAKARREDEKAKRKAEREAANVQAKKDKEAEAVQKQADAEEEAKRKHQEAVHGGVSS